VWVLGAVRVATSARELVDQLQATVRIDRLGEVGVEATSCARERSSGWPQPVSAASGFLGPPRCDSREASIVGVAVGDYKSSRAGRIGFLLWYQGASPEETCHVNGD